jgi:Aminoacyl-tRNA editing domain
VKFRARKVEGCRQAIAIGLSARREGKRPADTAQDTMWIVRSGGYVMAIAPTLQKFLDQNVTYEAIPHEPTLSSMRTAEACHISGDGLAKGIVLRRDDGMLAVLPASHHIRLSELRRQIGNDVDLADEMEINHCFGTVSMARSLRSASATD